MNEIYSEAKQREIERRIRHLMKIEQWAVNARKLLGEHYLIAGEDVDDVAIRLLCEEYDALISR